MTQEQIESLMKEIPGWSANHDYTSIERAYKLKDFRESVEFVNRVSQIAENEDHHPDINLHNYNKVKITLQTHAINGLSENDFIVASKIDASET